MTNSQNPAYSRLNKVSSDDRLRPIFTAVAAKIDDKAPLGFHKAREIVKFVLVRAKEKAPGLELNPTSIAMAITNNDQELARRIADTLEAEGIK